MTGNEVTTINEEKHPIVNYNINFIYDENIGKYIRPEELKYDKKDKNGNIIYDSNNVPQKGNISGVVEKVNGRSTKSIIQRMRKNIFNKKKGEK